MLCGPVGPGTVYGMLMTSPALAPHGTANFTEKVMLIGSATKVALLGRRVCFRWLGGLLWRNMCVFLVFPVLLVSLSPHTLSSLLRVNNRTSGAGVTWLTANPTASALGLAASGAGFGDSGAGFGDSGAGGAGLVVEEELEPPACFLYSSYAHCILRNSSSTSSLVAARFSRDWILSGW